MLCPQLVPCIAAATGKPNVIIVLTNDFDESRAVNASDTAVSFTANLKAGRTQLQTWFTAADGVEICGAYYVEVRKK